MSIHREKFKQVAELLNAKFIERFDTGDLLRFPDFDIFVRYDGWNSKGKYALSVSIQDENKAYLGSDLSKNRPSCNLTHEKNCTQLAKDIQNKILSKLEWFESVRSRIKDSNDYETVINENKLKACIILSEKFEPSTSSEVNFNRENLYGTVQVSKEGFSEIKIRSLSQELGEKILRLIASES